MIGVDILGLKNEEYIMNTIDYLYKNANNIDGAIYFTLNDLSFLRKNKFKVITINKNKDTEENLTEDSIINRLLDLYKLKKVLRHDTKRFEEILKENKVNYDKL